MGDTVWVLKEGQDEDDWDHSLILRENKELKRLSRELGVKRLDDLLDYSILNAEFSDIEEDPNYFEPAEIRPTLEALIAAIKAGKSRLGSPGEVVEELEDCLKKVLEAEDGRLRVRLSIVP